jgi:hypothetical protein
VSRHAPQPDHAANHLERQVLTVIRAAASIVCVLQTRHTQRIRRAIDIIISVIVVSSHAEFVLVTFAIFRAKLEAETAFSAAALQHSHACALGNRKDCIVPCRCFYVCPVPAAFKAACGRHLPCGNKSHVTHDTLPIKQRVTILKQNNAFVRI